MPATTDRPVEPPAGTPDADDQSLVDRVGTGVSATIGWADRFQRKHTWAAFPYAVIKKYGDDEAGKHAALLTYYGFLAIFPILLLAFVVIQKVLVGNPQLQQEFINNVVPEQLRSTVQEAFDNLPSSGVPLAIGVVGLVLSATGIVFTASDTLNHLSGIPQRARFGFVPRYLRGFAALLLLLATAGAVGGLTVLAGQLPDIGGSSRFGAAAGVLALTFLFLLLVTKLLIARPVAFSAVWPAAAIGAVVLTVLLTLGGALITGFVTRAGPVYGSFAAIVGLFALIYLVNQVLLYAAEIALVRRRRLWPRALDTSRPTIADARALETLAREQERLPTQRVTTHFQPADPEPPASQLTLPED